MQGREKEWPGSIMQPLLLLHTCSFKFCGGFSGGNWRRRWDHLTPFLSSFQSGGSHGTVSSWLGSLALANHPSWGISQPAAAWQKCVAPESQLSSNLDCSKTPRAHCSSWWVSFTHERYCFFFRYTRYFNDISFDAIYRDIFTIFSKCKLGQNAPKFHSWSAYVEIFATKWPTCGIFIRKHHTLGFFSTKMP